MSPGGAYLQEPLFPRRLLIYQYAFPSSTPYIGAYLQGIPSVFYVDWEVLVACFIFIFVFTLVRAIPKELLLISIAHI